MNHPLDRALLLFHQSRFDMAEQELRRVLAERPQEAGAHSLLGLCLARQEKLDEAQAETEMAIVLAPDEPFPHVCRSIVLEDRKRYKEAEESAREAVRLDPADADNYARLASTLFNQQKWQPCLDAALEGLAHDAEHAGCGNIRTMALTKLGRQREALATVDESLARDPDDALAHTNKGWALLHERKPKESLEHFREALRIDPNFEYARLGTVEALKARHFVYRWMLAYFLWMARMTSGARWAVILGGYFGYRFLSNVARENPSLQPWLTPILLAYLMFVLLTWFAMPLFNLLLRFNKYGRYALSRDMRVSSNWFALCLAVFAVAVAVNLATETDPSFILAVVAVGMALPLTTLYHCDVGWPRRSMAWYAAGLAAVGAAALAGAIYEQVTFVDTPIESGAFQLFLVGSVLTPWVANYLVTATARR